MRIYLGGKGWEKTGLLLTLKDKRQLGVTTSGLDIKRYLWQLVGEWLVGSQGDSTEASEEAVTSEPCW